MTDSLPIEYLLTSQTADGKELVVDPDKAGWADPKMLAATKVWSLVPRQQNGMPVVTVSIPDGGKPVYKSRVYGKLISGLSFRAYAIGYKLGRKTHWTWVMPNGNIEVGEDPIYADLVLRKMAGQT